MSGEVVPVLDDNEEIKGYIKIMSYVGYEEYSHKFWYVVEKMPIPTNNNHDLLKILMRLGSSRSVQVEADTLWNFMVPMLW